MDFVTGLPPLSGNTVVLTVVDHFSKVVHFIPLPKLHSAKEMAQVVIDHVFRIPGLPEDVVSHRGPQIISHFWREFCQQIGAFTSLSSGFHLQTNWQTVFAKKQKKTPGSIDIFRACLHVSDVLKMKKFLESFVYRQQQCQYDSHIRESLEMSKNAAFYLPGQ